jgi:hypothetical protein
MEEGVVLKKYRTFAIRRTACAHAQFSGCSPTTNAHSESAQMTVCCQNRTLGELSSRSALSVLVGALFIKFGLFLNMPGILAEEGNATVLSSYRKSVTEHPYKSNVGMYTRCSYDTQLGTPCLSATAIPPPNNRHLIEQWDPLQPYTLW